MPKERTPERKINWKVVLGVSAVLLFFLPLLSPWRFEHREYFWLPLAPLFHLEDIKAYPLTIGYYFSILVLIVLIFYQRFHAALKFFLFVTGCVLLFEAPLFFFPYIIGSDFRSSIEGTRDATIAHEIYLPRLKVGMTKEEVLAIYPGAKPADGYSRKVNEEIGDVWMGDDCLSVLTLDVCFKDGKVFAIDSGWFFKTHPGFKKIRLALDYTNVRTCEQIDDLPYYVGYINKNSCYEQVAKNTSRMEICELIDKADYTYHYTCIYHFVKRLGNIDFCALASMRFRDDCLIEAATDLNDVKICDRMENKSLRDRCTDRFNYRNLR